MIDALTISQSGLRASQEWLNQISNNVSNMHTVGFKKTSVIFSDIVSVTASSVQEDGAGSVVGMGTRASGAITDFSGGALKATNKQLDVAIQGNGLFEVELANGDVGYTRLGSLKVNEAGYLATQHGHVLSDRISVPAGSGSITINQLGVVSAVLDEGATIVELGTINVSMFNATESLVAVGDGLFVTSIGSGQANIVAPGEQGAGGLLQGYLETSNVELVEEMTNLVLAQRSYQLNARLIQAADQILETVNNLRR